MGVCGSKFKILAQLKVCFLIQERGQVFMLTFIIYCSRRDTYKTHLNSIHQIKPLLLCKKSSLLYSGTWHILLIQCF